MAKLCPKGKAAAKRKFDVYPSAYANMYASKVCKGKVKAKDGDGNEGPWSDPLSVSMPKTKITIRATIFARILEILSNFFPFLLIT